MRQNDTKYHQLYLMLKDDHNDGSNKGELLSIVKELYHNYIELIEIIDNKGKYGIRYKTIGEDSSSSDTYEQFFNTKTKRDDVYDDWINDRYYDLIFDEYLQYPTPSPNCHDIIKIFKENGVIYEEKIKNNE